MQRAAQPRGAAARPCPLERVNARASRRWRPMLPAVRGRPGKGTADLRGFWLGQGSRGAFVCSPHI
eukprot:scaffold406_cov391-Prasinococcus_capsulatus_cf.AAC.9